MESLFHAICFSMPSHHLQHAAPIIHRAVINSLGFGLCVPSLRQLERPIVDRASVCLKETAQFCLLLDPAVLQTEQLAASVPEPASLRECTAQQGTGARCCL